MYSLFKYKTPAPSLVKFQRIIMGWLAIASLFTESVNLVLLFFILTSIGIFTGTENSPVSLLYKIIKKVSSFDLVTITDHHIRYYQINSSVDFIDHLLRVIASASALLFFYSGLEIMGWGLMAFLSIFMMLSAYFGFCLSALSYIFLQRFTKIDDTSFTTNNPVNKNCTLAKNNFTPYKRCDSCHIDITQCLGTKFNIVMIPVGIAIASFLFIENRYLIEFNIIFTMSLLFWLGYQMNYSTDELTQSNNKNMILNRQLKEYNQTLEQEVQKRTSEIEHLVIHDQLTGVYNRYWFEKRVNNAIEEVRTYGTKYVLAFLDLDNFKTVNDNGGHLAGDELLRKISILMKNAIADDDYLARLGGDEFAILFEAKDIAHVVSTCNNLCGIVSDYRFDWEGSLYQIGVSIGVVEMNEETQNITELFRDSDKACYKAKSDGRNRVVAYNKELLN